MILELCKYEHIEEAEECFHLQKSSRNKKNLWRTRVCSWMKVLHLVPGELTDVELLGVTLGPTQRSVRRHLRAPASWNCRVPPMLGFSFCSNENVSKTCLTDVGTQQCADVLAVSQSQGSSSESAVQLSIIVFTLLLHQQVKLLLRLFNTQNHWGEKKRIIRMHPKYTRVGPILLMKQQQEI